MKRHWSPSDVLPHRPPMLLLSRVVSWGAGTLVGEVNVAGDSPFVEPGLGVPRWLALEYMAQAVGALDGIRQRESGHPAPPGYLLGTRRLHDIGGYFATGATLRITVEEILQGDNGLGVYSCRLDEGERSLSCRLTVYRPPASGVQPRA